MQGQNYLLLGQGLKIYNDAMRRFVRERLTAKYAGRWWEDGILRHLHDPQRSNLERDALNHPQREKHEFLDPIHLVHVVSEESRGAFAGFFDDARRSRALLQLVAEACNTHAHPPSGDLSRDEVVFALHAIEQLLRRANQPEADTVQRLRQGHDVKVRATSEPVRNTSPAATSPQSGAITNAAELNAADVAGKKVLCPACDTFVFQMWPEGWDGHAGWRCKGLDGTPEERKLEFRTRFGHLFRGRR